MLHTALVCRSHLGSGFFIGGNMSKAICMFCGKECSFSFKKISPGRCICLSCYNKTFGKKHTPGVTIEYPEKEDKKP